MMKKLQYFKNPKCYISTTSSLLKLLQNFQFLLQICIYCNEFYQVRKIFTTNLEVIGPIFVHKNQFVQIV